MHDKVEGLLALACGRKEGLRRWAPGLKRRLIRRALALAEETIRRDLRARLRDQSTPAQPWTGPPLQIPLIVQRKHTKPQTPGQTAPQPVDLNEYRAQTLILITLNVRGMHLSILDVIPLVQKRAPTILVLTETKHDRIKSIWGETLRHYKLIHTPARERQDTGRRYGGVVLVAGRQEEGIPAGTG